jgi:hypothetical protein
MVGYTKVHYFDLSFYVDWSAALCRTFSGLHNIENLDYPPLFCSAFYYRKLMGMEAFLPLILMRCGPQGLADAVRSGNHPFALWRGAARR